MSDPLPAGERKKTFIERLSAMLLRTPDDRDELIDLLRRAHQRFLFDAEALSMIEGVLQVSQLSVRDIMVPRSQMEVIDIRETPEQFLPRMVKTAHSRFPVVDGNRDRVIGILHAKDLLRTQIDPDISIRDLLRPPVFVPESKRLNVLLHDFRADQHHLAIVVDEYGGSAGLITIEDVLEQIVGDIEDEFDFDEEVDHIVAVEPGATGPRFRVRALASISQVNAMLKSDIADEGFDTIGGLVTDRLGRVPRRGERVTLDGVQFEVLRSDARQAHLFLAERTALIHPANAPDDAQ
jgi:magnesium and cobalt transporter